MKSFSDRLCHSIIEKKSPLAVGIDPVLDKLPPDLKGELHDGAGAAVIAEAFVKFGLAIIEISAPLVAAVKINSAYFERYHAPGVSAYRQLIKAARQANLIVIGDVKRSDIGHTAEQYAIGHLTDTDYMDSVENIGPDAITINGYLGSDGVKPFLHAAVAGGKGVFVLVRTSNPSSLEVQELLLSNGRPVYLQIAELVDRWGNSAGSYGYGDLGAVVGATTGPALAAVRAAAPKAIFLIPGMGAQGGSLADCLPAFDRRGLGAVIAASRSIIYAYRDAKYAELADIDWRRAVEQSLVDHKMQIASMITYS